MLDLRRVSRRKTGQNKITEKEKIELMNGVVSRLYDIDSIVIPEELLKIHIEEAQLDAEVKKLSLRYAKEELTGQVARGDLVSAEADRDSYPDGRTILIYPGMQLPEARQAEEALIGKRTGEQCQTNLAGKDVTLTIRQILHRTPVEVTDALIEQIGLDAIKTVEDYRNYMREKMTQDQEMEKSKEITRYLLEQMQEHSEFQYDETEMKDYVDSEMQRYAEEIEEAEPASPEEVREGIIGQTKQSWMAKAFCEEKKIEPDLSFVEEDTDRMVEMMQLMGEEIPDRKEMIEMAVQDAYFNAMLEYIDQLIEQKMGGSNGNS